MEPSVLKPREEQVTVTEENAGEEDALSRYGRITEDIQRLKEELRRTVFEIVAQPRDGEKGKRSEEILKTQGIESPKQNVIVLRSVEDAVCDLPHVGEGVACDVILDKATDEDLRFLASCGQAAKITSLDLCGTKVTDGGMKEVSKLTSLTSLDLCGTKVTDGGMKEVSNLTSLTSLDLGGTKVTDEGMEAVSNLANLTSLNLGATNVTDEGMEAVSNLANLTSLYLRGTKVTDEGVQKLREALPGCRVIR